MTTVEIDLRDLARLTPASYAASKVGNIAVLNDAAKIEVMRTAFQDGAPVSKEFIGTLEELKREGAIADYSVTPKGAPRTTGEYIMDSEVSITGINAGKLTDAAHGARKKIFTAPVDVRVSLMYLAQVMGCEDFGVSIELFTDARTKETDTILRIQKTSVISPLAVKKDLLGRDTAQALQNALSTESTELHGKSDGKGGLIDTSSFRTIRHKTGKADETYYNMSIVLSGMEPEIINRIINRTRHEFTKKIIGSIIPVGYEAKIYEGFDYKEETPGVRISIKPGRMDHTVLDKLMVLRQAVSAIPGCDAQFSASEEQAGSGSTAEILKILNSASNTQAVMGTAVPSVPNAGPAAKSTADLIGTIIAARRSPLSQPPQQTQPAATGDMATIRRPAEENPLPSEPAGPQPTIQARRPNQNPLSKALPAKPLPDSPTIQNPTGQKPATEGKPPATAGNIGDLEQTSLGAGAGSSIVDINQYIPKGLRLTVATTYENFLRVQGAISKAIGISNGLV